MGCDLMEDIWGWGCILVCTAWCSDRDDVVILDCHREATSWGQLNNRRCLSPLHCWASLAPSHGLHLEGEMTEITSDLKVFCFCSVQLLSRVRLFDTPLIAACQASLSITNSWNPPKPMSIELVMPSNHLSLSSSSPPALNLFQHQGLFKWVSSSHQVAKVLEFQLQHHSFQWTPRTDLL